MSPVGEKNAQFKQFEEELCPSRACDFTERQISTQSTEAPSSPPTSRPMSRMVTPQSDFTFEKARDTMGGARPDLKCRELATKVPTAAHSSVIDGCRRGAALFLLVSWAIGLFFVPFVSVAFRCFMGALAILMLLPGLYLYIVDGCRPEDYNEEHVSTWKTAGAILCSFLMLCLASFYCVNASTTLCIFMGIAAAMLILPGLYLYVVDGCRPEDYEGGDCCSQKNLEILLLSLVSLGLIYGMWFFVVLRIFMGAMAAMVFLPGLYLYVIDGCRPEDCEEAFCKKQD